jgi:hypothetical protein
MQGCLEVAALLQNTFKIAKDASAVVSACWHSAFPCVFVEIAGRVGEIGYSTHFRAVDLRSG